jgi:DNA-binding LacI/PurR family transcriptional regulator
MLCSWGGSAPVTLAAGKWHFVAARFDGHEFALYGDGSTIDQETRQVGARAAELLLTQIESKRLPRANKILIAPRLVQRESTQSV